MSLPSTYTALLNELNRDIIRSAPSDPLQYCASWFLYRLEQDRIQARAGSGSLADQHHHNPNPQQQQQQQPHHHHRITPPASATATAAPTPLSPPQHYQYPISHTPAALVSSHYYHYYNQPAPPNHYHHHHPPPHYHHPHHHPNHFSPYQHPTATAAPPPPPPPPPPAINPTYSLDPTQPNSNINPYSVPVHHSTDPHHQPHPHQQRASQPDTNPAGDHIRPYSFGRSVTPIDHRPLSSSSDHGFGPTDLSMPHQPSTATVAINNDRLYPNRAQSGQQFPSSLNHNQHASPGSNYNRSPSPRGGRSSNPVVIQHTPSAHSQTGDDDSDESSDESNTEPVVPAGYNFGRRISVSAESLSPSNLDMGPPIPKTVIAKTVEQRERIEASIKENLLFRNLDEEQYNDVLNAMSEVRVGQGTEVIVQGAVGDFFYVVEQGTFDVYVRGPPTYTYVPPSNNQSQGTLSLGGSNTPNGVTMTNPFGRSFTSSSPALGSSTNEPLNTSATTNTGTTVTHQAPSKKVHTYGPGGSFGELALMYNAPRAATVVATSPTATLWALDRVTFRSILMEHTSRKRRMYEVFLSEVPILVSLSPAERSKIADTLEERTFGEGTVVIKEGEVGREFFIIESGRAEVSKKRANGGEEVVGLLGKGDHFGELALLNSAPRAATVRAAGGSGRLKVAALGEKAFTRLLGPVVDILSRHAESHYRTEPGNHQVQADENGNSGVGNLGGSSSSGPFGNWNGLNSLTNE